ncbi:MAG: hypothetical protein FWE67_07470 [Planctomycetaceae bacterium]|nr:hypothetical protein [Planctomycetaceae bacterium]
MSRTINESYTQNNGGRMPFRVPSVADNVKRNLNLLNDFSVLLSKDNDKLTGVGRSTYYGLARPLMREIYLSGESALPVLVDFFESNTYLYSYSGMRSMAPGDRADVTLGDVAKELFEDIVCPIHGMPYKMRVGADGQLHTYPNFRTFLRGQSHREWWNVNKTKSLLELQCEVVDFLIEKEKEIGFHKDEQNAEQKYLMPLLEMRRKLPIIKPEYLKD